MKRILHITPALPPIVNGLGDFCNLLAKKFDEKGFENLFFVTKKDPLQKSKNVFEFAPHTIYSKLEIFDASVIMLHYAGYAYHHKGVPFYLLRAIKKYKSKSGCKLFIFFHELYSSSSSPLRLSFYTRPFQKQIVKSLYGQADKTFTNCHIYHDLLRQVIVKEPMKNLCTGIYSNIPDALYDDNTEKTDEAIVFGSLDRRNAVYQTSEFESLLARHKISIVHDIGPGKPSFSQQYLSIKTHGCLEPPEAAKLLSKARFGFIDYPPGLLAKSGIFSAYCAFGVIAINVYKNHEPLFDGLIEDKNYFNTNSVFEEGWAGYARAKQEIKKWYQKRNEAAISNTIINQA